MSTQTKEQNHAEDQAMAQLECIVEMVRDLDEDKAREVAAYDFAKRLDREQCTELLTEASIEVYDTETLETLQDAVTENISDETIIPDDFDFEFDEEEARRRIQEDALSVQVRSDWYTLGEDQPEPAEFEILLCTGGPAVRIVGDLNSGSPDRPRLEYQDWFTSWTELIIDNDEKREALQTYCEQFYFGD